ncbi:RseA family anti-sigma factor [Vibrio sp.]|nr:RseA family anti-sigma factor [Vibrio sp.]
MSKKEQLSALMDNELSAKELDALLHDDLGELNHQVHSDALAVWKSYHTMRDTLNDQPMSPEWNIADSVALALEKEESYTAKDNLMSKDVKADVTPIENQPKPTKARWDLPSWFTGFGQVAVAACVSMVVIFGVQQFNSNQSPNGDRLASSQETPVLQTVPLFGSVEPVSLNREESALGDEKEIQKQRMRALLHDYELQLKLNNQYHSEK